MKGISFPENKRIDDNQKKEVETVMKNVLVTGAAGLVGSEAVRFYSARGYKVIGIDNDMRKYFFGDVASTKWNIKELTVQCPDYEHHNMDIRDNASLDALFNDFTFDLIIHAAAQPSHDWAAKEPFTDFSINANGTLNLLENFRRYCSEGVFVFTSTNKVYGDTPNNLPLTELDTRYEVEEKHRFSKAGIDESMSIDQCKHSLFGASKASADLLVQEYGRYFQLKTVCFRAGCITGSHHSGAELHGFLAYLAKCIMTGKTYFIYGYKGKQVRDNIHAYDLVNAFDHFYHNPGTGQVYNMGGSRHSNISMMEAIQKIEGLAGKKAKTEYEDTARIGDHIWYISDVSKFKKDYPQWDFTYDMDGVLKEIVENIKL